MAESVNADRGSGGGGSIAKRRASCIVEVGYSELLVNEHDFEINAELLFESLGADEEARDYAASGTCASRHGS